MEGACSCQPAQARRGMCPACFCALLCSFSRLYASLWTTLQAPPPEKKERQPRIWNLKPHLKPQTDEQRNPQLPKSVPLPARVEDITHAGMRAMWEEKGSGGASSAAPLALDVEPLDD